MNVLVLKSSILADNSQSNKLADYTIEKLKDHNIVVRDLAAQRRQLRYVANVKLQKKMHF